MKIVVPTKTNETRLISTNVAADDYPEYSSTTTYNTGDRVIVLGNNVNNIYEVVSADPVSGVNPVTDDSDPAKWLKVSAINRWKMFDRVISTQTVAESTFNESTYVVSEYQDGSVHKGVAVTIRPNDFSDSIAFFNVQAQYADIRVETIEGFIYEKRIPLRGVLSVPNWYAYFYEPISFVAQTVNLELPRVLNKDIHISFVETDTTQPPKVGEVVVGAQKTVGKSLYGTSLGILDFSRKERNAFGDFEIVERGFADTMEVNMSILNSDVSSVKRLFSELRSVPAVYIAGDCIDATAVYGYFSDFQITINGPYRSDANAIIEGLT